MMFATRRSKELAKHTWSDPAPGVPWNRMWTLKVVAAEYKHSGMETPRAGKPAGKQKMTTRVSAVMKTQLKTSLKKCAKELHKAFKAKTKAEGTIKRLQELKQKLTLKAEEKEIDVSAVLESFHDDEEMAC